MIAPNTRFTAPAPAHTPITVYEYDPETGRQAAAADGEGFIFEMPPADLEGYLSERGYKVA